MPLTPETLTRHELNGLHARVVESTDPSRVGTAGRVVSETMQMLAVSDDSGVTQVPKRGTTFEFRLTDESAVAPKAAGTASEPVSDESHTAGYDAAYVTVDGTKLLSRPAFRSEQGVDSKWR
ncbi:ribonuclease P protein component 1 [Halobacterium zhouii]|uniref:ribonuclease P protein component 1 n=1 Tax=Halobacterium zhouii TaxID=2902624 RepID=UPI001E3C872A|nr:ribonuclease P protein component 1 [Halobacterium zhouii]